MPSRLILVTSNNVDVPTASFFIHLDAQIPAVPFRFWAILIAAVGAGTFLVAKRPFFPIMTAVLAFTAVTAQVDYRDKLTASQARALSWVDHTLPAGADATLVYLGVPFHNDTCSTQTQQALTIWTEFFNTHVDAVKHVYESNPSDGLASTRLDVGKHGRVLSNGKPFRPAFLIVDSRQRLVGRPIARFDLSKIDSQSKNRASLTLWRVERGALRFSLSHPTPADARTARHSRVVPANLIPNGEFEMNLDGWHGNAGTETIARTTLQSVSGTHSMIVTTAGSKFSGVYMEPNIATRPKANFSYSFYLKGASAERSFRRSNGTPVTH